ncbi:MAG: hypothetical protein H8D56_06970 [Planctomycetes bacterium]|nr:hypothetical protein [Planctomycetota bacterium]MBL7143122.1 hypothetical protein [Phycisphaerae bacterium]
MYKQCVIVLLCISIAANLTHWKVLCFGADGHIEFESAFHERCDNPTQSSASDKSVFSSQAGHEICNHCGPCIDVPISSGLAKVSRTPQQLNQKFPVPATSILAVTYKDVCSAYYFTSNTFNDTSYFDPLRTVILLV